jgi:16S rRNA (cytosine1402-N4)-methyltransferase
MFHTPVMAAEVTGLLIVRPDGTLMDLTCGGGGHLKKLSDHLSEKATLIGIDRDPDAVRVATESLENAPQDVKIIHSLFSRFDSVLRDLKISKVDGVLMDLGLSSHHIDSPDRGFSFIHDGPLDMRMDFENNLTAGQIINNYSMDELVRIFKDYGEEKRSVKAADCICQARRKNEITSTHQLVEILKPILSKKYLNASLARIFQALRIEVNQEIEQLKTTLPKVLDHLSMGGRLAVIAYHSLEDRVVKRFFAQQAKGCICPPHIPECVCGKLPRIKILTKKVIKPSPEEIKQNSRARSAKLRVAEKIA